MRLLILTRYYPPEISGGARRPKGFVEALRNAGVDVTLCGPSGIVDDNFIAVPHPSFPALPRDDGKTNALNLLERTKDWARKHLMLPDPEIRWALRSVATIKASGLNFDWIMTTSPPESLHVAGAMLKRHYSCKWVADVRDMWIESPQRRELARSEHRQWIEAWIAKATLRHVDAIVAVSQAVMSETARYSRIGVPRAVIGHFAEPFLGQAEAFPIGNFNIVHTGAITLSNPLSEFTALLGDFEALAKQRKDVILWLAGNLTAQEHDAFEFSPFASQIRLLGPVSMDRARALQMGADALALVSGSKSHALPGKFSEYAQTGKPILVSAPGPWINLIGSNITTYSFDDVNKWTHDRPKGPAYTYDAAAAASQLLQFLNAI